MSYKTRSIDWICWEAFASSSVVSIDYDLIWPKRISQLSFHHPASDEDDILYVQVQFYLLSTIVWLCRLFGNNLIR